MMKFGSADCVVPVENENAFCYIVSFKSSIVQGLLVKILPLRYTATANEHFKTSMTKTSKSV
jgi:hypothetical protein